MKSDSIEDKAREIYNTKLRWRNSDHYRFDEAPEWIRKLAFREAKEQILAEE